jgi:hypothetical protein
VAFFYGIISFFLDLWGLATKAFKKNFSKKRKKNGTSRFGKAFTPLHI